MSATFNHITGGNPKIEMTEEQRYFLMSHHDSMSNKEMAERLNVSCGKIHIWLTELGIVKKKGLRFTKARQVAESDFFIHDKNLATI